jgi:LysR family hydrogen peroxide-inducible transcriptional activator
VELRKDTGLVARRFAKPAPSRTIGLAWRPGAARGAEYRLLGQTLAAALAPRARAKRRR